MYHKLVFIFLFFVCCKNNSLKKEASKSPKNVIFLISDGTGLSHISAAYYYKKSDVNYSRFQHIGLITTHSSQEYITDSAASATAFATGEKTNNGAVGVLEDSTQLKNLVEIASKKGVKTGIVATSAITHATPASFFAHVMSRNFEEKIALQLINSDIDYFAGGGKKFFNNRFDKLNLFDAQSSNEFIIDTLALKPFESIKNHKKQAFVLSADGMPKMNDGRGDFLSKATLLGIEFLHQNDAPFFLMSEGSQIDWGGHDNDVEYLISELLDFDETLGYVLDFAEQDGETLVIVTSDHETGGFTLSAKNYTNSEGRVYKDYSKLDPKFSTNGHSATLIPVFAYGPGSELFSGVYDNTDIFKKIIQLTAWGK
jgi:alkaline phosphatase